MRVLLSDHLDDVVVLRNGAAALGLSKEAAFPPWVLGALRAAEGAAEEAPVLRFLRHVVEEHPDVATTHKANVEFMNSSGVQKEAKARSRVLGARRGVPSIF